MDDGRGSWLRPVATVLGALAVLLVVDADAARADPAGPTHHRSTVTAVIAEDDGSVPIEVEVIGGDAFLVVRSRPGVTVEVPGYEGEPYLRLGSDGVIEVNDRSPALWLNEERYGAQPPAGADADAPPRWVHVADGHEYAWHEHRIHFMSPQLPPGVDPASGDVQPVFDWEIPIMVDGREVTITGSLDWVPSRGPLVPVTAAGVAIALLVAARRRLTPPVTAGAGARAALAVSLPMGIGLPAGADADVALVALPGAAAVLAVLGSWWSEGRRARLVQAAAAVPLVVWAVLLGGALTRPIVPGPLPTSVVQVAVVVVALTGVVTLAGVLRGRSSGAEGQASG